MNINLKFLLGGVAVWLFPQYAAAQCAETDCLKLGYNKLQKCDNGLKCPFGEYWACPCDEAYKYACTDSNEQPGTDKCGEKYKSCTCASGYEWKDGKCQTKVAIFGQCTGYAKNCKIGDILNSDGTCSNDKVSGKTPIGVVVAIKDYCGYAMTISTIRTSISWSTENINTGVLQSTDWRQAIKDFNVSGNMTKIIKASKNNSSTYPAAYAALNYAPSTAPSTKGKWALPTAGILNSLYKNLNTINNTMSKLGYTHFPGDYTHIWSSTEFSSNTAWAFCKICSGCTGEGGLGCNLKYYNSGQYVVYPVLAF